MCLRKSRHNPIFRNEFQKLFIYNLLTINANKQRELIDHPLAICDFKSCYGLRWKNATASSYSCLRLLCILSLRLMFPNSGTFYAQIISAISIKQWRTNFRAVKCCDLVAVKLAKQNPLTYDSFDCWIYKDAKFVDNSKSRNMNTLHFL